MARYVDAIDLPIPLEQAFDYLADFSRTAEWDPGVVEAERLTPGPPRRGSRFRVVPGPPASARVRDHRVRTAHASGR